MITRRSLLREITTGTVTLGWLLLSGCTANPQKEDDEKGQEKEQPAPPKGGDEAPRKPVVFDPTKGPIKCVGHTGVVMAVAITPDGKTAFSAGADRTLRFWDTRDGSELRKIELFKPDNRTPTTFQLTVSPDGLLLVAATPDPQLRFWEVESGKEVTGRYGIPRALAVAFAQDGKRLAAVGYSETHRVWEMPAGRLLAEIPKPPEDGSARHVAFSPDGENLAISCSGSKDEEMPQPRMKVWNLQTKKVVFQPTSEFAHIACVSFSPDGKQLAVGGSHRTMRKAQPREGVFMVADTQMPHTTREVRTGTLTIRSLVYSPKDRWLVTAGDGGKVACWDTRTGEPLAEVNAGRAAVSGLALSRNGLRLVAASEGTLLIWSLP